MLNYITIKPELMERQIVETDQYWWSRKLDGHFIRIQKQGDELKFKNKSLEILKIVKVVVVLALAAAITVIEVVNLKI